MGLGGSGGGCLDVPLDWFWLPCKACTNSVLCIPCDPTTTPAQEYLRMDAAVIAGGTLYVAEFRRELNETGVLDMSATLGLLRIAKPGWVAGQSRKCVSAGQAVHTTQQQAGRHAG